MSQECGRGHQNFNTSKLSKIWDREMEGAGALKIQWYVYITSSNLGHKYPHMQRKQNRWGSELVDLK